MPRRPVHPNAELGDTVVGRDRGSPGGPRILLIGHLDTVFPEGTVAERPYRVEAGRALRTGRDRHEERPAGGPVRAAGAARACESDRRPLPHPPAWLPFERLMFVANPDEEIGSPASSPVIRDLARGRGPVPRPRVRARQRRHRVGAQGDRRPADRRSQGRAAHAGVEPEKGRSAILEAAHQILALHALNGRWPGVTCNVGVVEGGTRPNVVAERAGSAGGPALADARGTGGGGGWRSGHSPPSRRFPTSS